MKNQTVAALRHIGGILLAAIGALFTIGTIAAIAEPDPEFPAWSVAIMLVLFALLPLVGAFFLLRRSLGAPPRNCPKCAADQRRACFGLMKERSFWLFHAAGWILAALWGASREERVECLACSTVYETHTRSTRIAGVLLWVFVLLIAFGVLAQKLGLE